MSSPEWVRRQAGYVDGAPAGATYAKGLGAQIDRLRVFLGRSGEGP